MQDEQEWCYSYSYLGREYAGRLFAKDRMNAERKLAAMGRGRIDGEFVMEIPVPTFLQRLVKWFHGI